MRTPVAPREAAKGPASTGNRTGSRARRCLAPCFAGERTQGHRL